MKLKNKIENPCDSCHRSEKGYAVGRKHNGKIVRYDCYDNCEIAKEYCRKIVKNIIGEIKNE